MFPKCIPSNPRYRSHYRIFKHIFGIFSTEHTFFRHKIAWKYLQSCKGALSQMNNIDWFGGNLRCYITWKKCPNCHPWLAVKLIFKLDRVKRKPKPTQMVYVLQIPDSINLTNYVPVAILSEYKYFMLIYCKFCDARFVTKDDLRHSSLLTSINLVLANLL